MPSDMPDGPLEDSEPLTGRPAEDEAIMARRHLRAAEHQTALASKALKAANRAVAISIAATVINLGAVIATIVTPLISDQLAETRSRQALKDELNNAAAYANELCGILGSAEAFGPTMRDPFGRILPFARKRAARKRAEAVGEFQRSGFTKSMTPFYDAEMVLLDKEDDLLSLRSRFSDVSPQTKDDQATLARDWGAQISGAHDACFRIRESVDATAAASGIEPPFARKALSESFDAMPVLHLK